MTFRLSAAFLSITLLLAGCVSMPKAQRLQAAGYASGARSQAEQCLPANPCAPFSPLRELGDTAYAESTPEAAASTGWSCSTAARTRCWRACT